MRGAVRGGGKGGKKGERRTLGRDAWARESEAESRNKEDEGHGEGGVVKIVQEAEERWEPCNRIEGGCARGDGPQGRWSLWPGPGLTRV